MLMVFLEGVETGRGGAHAELPVGEVLEGTWHSAEQTSSQCGNPSAGPHLVHQGHLHAA